MTARRWPRRGRAPQSSRGVPWAPSGGLLSGHLFNVVAQQLILLWKREQRYFVEERWWHGQARPALLPGAVTTQNSIRSRECRLLKVRDDTALGHQHAACREVHSLEPRSLLSWKRCYRGWPHRPSWCGQTNCVTGAPFAVEPAQGLRGARGDSDHALCWHFGGAGDNM